MAQLRPLLVDLGKHVIRPPTCQRHWQQLARGICPSPIPETGGTQSGSGQSRPQLGRRRATIPRSSAPAINNSEDVPQSWTSPRSPKVTSDRGAGRDLGTGARHRARLMQLVRYRIVGVWSRPALDPRHELDRGMRRWWQRCTSNSDLSALTPTPPVHPLQSTTPS